MSSNEIRKFIKILNEAVESTPGRIPCVFGTDEGMKLFTVDSEETYEMLIELENAAQGSAEFNGGILFDVPLDDETAGIFKKIRPIKINNAEAALNKYYAKSERYDGDDDRVVEYAQKIFAILTKYAVPLNARIDQKYPNHEE